MRFMYFVAFVIFVILASGPVAQAQELLTRFDFHLDAQYLTSDDPRFNWSFDLGGDLDVVDWEQGRAYFRINYEALAGEEFRRFDVNQGNYLLEGGALFRVHGLEVGPVWHHISRHLSDRGKRFPIDWNMIAGRVGGTWQRGTARVAFEVDGRKTVTNIYVDYDWEIEATSRMVKPLTARWALVAAGNFRYVGVDGTRDRGNQVGGRAEAGVRMSGRVASAELFAGLERRIDPYVLEFNTASWFLAGLRLTSVP